MNRDLQQLVEEARAGGPRALRAAARLMSVATDDPRRLGEMLAGSRSWPQPRLVLGVTGAPGSGKSTLVDGVAAEFRRRWPERRLGIVAVDPSSPFTGGALLGDRVRMMRHATDPGVFIRSLATRGQLGGLALGAKGVVRILGLAGCDAVIVETVGVGQSEVEIARHADVTAVVLAPGQGDSIQLLKAGLVEAGDLFVVNKADRADAAALHQQLLAALQLELQVRAGTAAGTGGGVRPVFLCSAVLGSGVAELVAALDAMAERSRDSWRRRRRDQAADEVRQSLVQEINGRVDALLGRTEATDHRLARVLAGEATVSEVADELLREAAADAARPDAAHADAISPPRFHRQRTANAPHNCEGARR